MADLDERTIIRPKLIRFGDTVYRRLDVEADGIVDDYTLKKDPKTGFYLPKKFVDKNNSKKKKYNIDELEAEGFQEQSVTPSTGFGDVDDDEDLILKEGEELYSNNNTNSSRGLTLKLRICPVFYSFIIGKRGLTKANIESETRTRVTIPRENENVRNGSGGSFITIAGSDKRSLGNAKKRIDSLIESFRNKQVLTHFVAVPIGPNESIRARFEEFKAQVLADVDCSTSKGITESVFHSGPRLHLTLRALYLGDSFERKQATEMLHSLKSDFLDSLMKDKPKVVLHVKGLDYMNDDPSEVNVLYAKVEEVGGEGLFKQIVNKTFDCFTPLSKGSHGLENSDWKVKIHATLLNTRFSDEQELQAKDGEASVDPNIKKGGGRGGGKRKTIDVRNIMAKFEDFDFGTFTLDQMHICTVGGEKKDTEYYVTLAKIDF